MISRLAEAWRVFLCEVEISKHHHLCYSGLGAPIYRNPILDRLLPSLLYLKMVALFDEFLEAYISQKGLVLPPQFRQDLNGRLNFLDSLGALSSPVELHSIRKLRNEIAHDGARHADWGALDYDLAKIHGELRHFGFVGPKPDLKFHFEGTPFEKSSDPKILWERDIVYGAKEGQEWVYAISHRHKVFRTRS